METRSSATSSDTCTLLPKPPITIVILTWNALDYTKRCLESLCANTDHPDYHVIVADNGSSDGTIEYLQSVPWVKVLLNGDNLGFAAGNNRAIRIADPASTWRSVSLTPRPSTIPKDGCWSRSKG